MCDKLAQLLYQNGHIRLFKHRLVCVLLYIIDNELSANFKNKIMTLYIPKIMIAQFVNTNNAAVEASYGEVQLLLEKDSIYPDTISDDQSDSYPNPFSLK